MGSKKKALPEPTEAQQQKFQEVNDRYGVASFGMTSDGTLVLNDDDGDKWKIDPEGRVRAPFGIAS